MAGLLNLTPKCAKKPPIFDSVDKRITFISLDLVYVLVYQCTVFRKAYILSGSGFHEFLYSIIESLKKIREIAEFIPNQLRFHEKKL